MAFRANSIRKADDVCFYSDDGYLCDRTRRSQLSEEAWNAAQFLYGKYATIMFAITSAATVIAGITIVIINPDEDTSLALFLVITAVQVGVLMVVIVMVEHELKIHIDEDGKSKQNQ